jgi:hypothetical protein
MEYLQGETSRRVNRGSFHRQWIWNSPTSRMHAWLSCEIRHISCGDHDQSYEADISECLEFAPVFVG